MNTGVKRLAVVLGCAGAVAHLVFVLVFVPDFEQSLTVYCRIAAITVACFVVPFGLVYGTAWIIQGFREPSKNQEQQSPNPQGGANDRSRRVRP